MVFTSFAGTSVPQAAQACSSGSWPQKPVLFCAVFLLPFPTLVMNGPCSLSLFVCRGPSLFILPWNLAQTPNQSRSAQIQFQPARVGLKLQGWVIESFRCFAKCFDLDNDAAQILRSSTLVSKLHVRRAGGTAETRDRRGDSFRAHWCGQELRLAMAGNRAMLG